MLIASLIVNGVLAFVAWRLKGPRTLEEAARVLVQGGGGPGEEGPGK